MLEDDYADGAVESRLDAVCIFLHSHDILEYANLTMRHPQTQARVLLSLHYYAKDALVTSYSTAQFDALVAASTPIEAMRWETLRGVGYRKNEQAHAEYTDFRDRVVSIEAKPRYGWKPKSDAGTRLVTISSRLKEMVERWHHEHPTDRLLFPDANGQPETGSKLLYCLKVRAWKAGLNCGTCEGRRYDDKTFSCREAPVCSLWKLHRFRASYATDLYRSRKFTELQIMKFMGHSDFKVTQRYLALAKANDPETCAAMDSVWKPVDSQMAVSA
jgi:integrase